MSKLFHKFADVTEIEDAGPLSFLYTETTLNMVKEEIIAAIGQDIEAIGCFITDVTVSKDNDIEISMEKEEGEITMEDCVTINHKFHEKFSQDEEDYSLTVTSAGLDRPFKVFKQYKKAIGYKVIVKTRDSRKIEAVLKDATESTITISYSKKEVVEGSKKKQMVRHEEVLPLSGINSVEYYIEIE